MNKIKELTVFTVGDSDKISTWSNVPYFFTKTLVSKGLIINRIDLRPSPVLNKLYTIFIEKIAKLFFKKSTYNYFRSLPHYLLVRQKIKKAIKKYPNSDANVFMTFSFSSTGIGSIPSIQVCDWTYDHYFKYFENRKPYFFERTSIQRENKMIEGSDYVFPLFPGVAEYMRTQYKNKNIHYLGHVINSIYEASEDDAIEIKLKSNDLLFVGNIKYLEGATYLIKAFKLLKSKYPDLTLHIIGMNENDLKDLPAGIKCYGYLDKGNDQQRELYYSLFQRAKIYINTTDKWGAFSATVEAMYFFTPVIVTQYDEFVRTFGDEISFGYYCDSRNTRMLQKKIMQILDDPSYKCLCLNAHNEVKTFTWQSFVEKFLKKIGALTKETKTPSIKS